MPLVKISGLLGTGAMVLGGLTRLVASDPLDGTALFMAGSLKNSLDSTAMNKKMYDTAISRSKDTLDLSQGINNSLANDLRRHADTNRLVEPVTNRALMGAAALPVVATGAAITKNTFDPEEADDNYGIKKKAFISGVLASMAAPSIASHIPGILTAIPLVTTGVGLTKNYLKNRELSKVNDDVAKSIQNQHELKAGIENQKWDMAKNVGKVGLLAASVPASYYLYKNMTKDED